MRRPGFFAAVADWVSGFFDKRLWRPSHAGRKTTSLECVSETSALKYSAVWCATRLLCGTGASLPLPIYVGKDDDTRTKDRTHPLYRILNVAPNPEQTAYNFRSIMWQWQVNWGNAYAEIEREGNVSDGAVVSLWPIHPERVEVCRDDNGVLFYRVSNEGGGGDKVELEAWQMLHIPSIITADGIVGLGVIEHARESIGVGLAQEKSEAHSMGGGRMPRMALEGAGKWGDDQRLAFKQELKDIYSGADGDTVAVLQGDAKLVPLSFKAVDAQFLENRQFNLDELARFYGIPPHLLQNLMKATFNNIEELGINFVQYSLIAWLKIWEQCIAQKLLSPEEQVTHFAEHNVDALLRGNAAARASFYQVMISAMIMSRNECRKLENLNPVPGGDTFLAQGALVPLDEDGRPESAFVNGKNTSVTTGGAVVPDGEDELSDQPLSGASVRSVTKRIERIITHDLSRFLTKETKAMAGFAKKPEDFVSLVDTFYTNHAALVRDEMTETLGALSACGIDASIDMFVASWVNEGKQMILEASGTAVTAAELTTAVQVAVDSRTWTERPLRAVEGVSECKRSTAICG